MSEGGGRPAGPPPARFGVFEFDPKDLSLRRNGYEVKLQNQSAMLLGYLVQRAGQLVTRDELRAAIWPSGTYVEFDFGLNSAMSRLRRTLGDSADEPRYIETVPKQGYRFVAPVEITLPVTRLEVVSPLPRPAPPDASPPMPAEAPPVHAPIAVAGSRSTGFRLSAALAVALAAVAGYEVWHSTRKVELPFTLLNRAFLTSFPGEQVTPSISPDGGQVAFSWTDPAHDHVPSIYVTAIDGLGLHRLTPPGSTDLGPVWSPDGSQIAFVRQEENGPNAVIVIPSAGGAERRVSSTHARYTAWTPGGREIIAGGPRPHQRNYDLDAVSVATGEHRRLTHPDQLVDAWERFGYSPDGSRFAFTGWTGPQGAPEILVQPASGGSARQVTRLGISLRGWCWLPDSRSLLVVSNEPGARRLFRLRLDDPQLALAPLSGGGDETFHPATAAAGGEVRAVFSQQSLTTNIFRFTVERDARGLPVKLSAPQAVAPATRRTANPQVSPDGRRLAFISNRSLFDEIWIASADGLNLRPLTSFGPSHILPGSPRWSPDGSKIVFAAQQDGVTDLYLAGADGGPIAHLTHHSFDAVRPSWSHDGQWIYFSRRESTVGSFSLWKIPARANATENDAVPLFGLAGAEPIESPEGGTLYYMPTFGGRELWATPLAGGAPRLVIASGIVNGWWSPAPGGVYYADLSQLGGPDEPEHATIYFFDLAANAARPIGTLPGRAVHSQPGLSLSGDTLFTDWEQVSTVNLVRGDLKN